MWQAAGRHLRFLVSVITTMALITPNVAFAARRYWVGNYSTAWDDAKNWSATQGGFGGAAVPTISDTAILHSTNSGNTISIGRTAFAGGIILTPTFTGALRVGTSALILGGTGARIGSGYFIIGTGTTLNSSGTWLQSGGVVFNTKANHRFALSGSLILKGKARFRYSGTLVFNNDNADQILAFSGSRVDTRPTTNVVGQHAFSGIILDNTAGTTADDLIISGSLLRLKTLVITRGNFKLDGGSSLDNNAPSVPLSISGSITIADNAQATFSTDTNVRMSGSLSTGASGRFTMSGGTLTLNGIEQYIDMSGVGSELHTVVLKSSGSFTSTALITASLTVTGSNTLRLGTNTVYLTGATIDNYGTINEGTGKLVHSGSLLFITDSAYAQDIEVRSGETMYLTLTDTDENIDGTVADSVSVTVAITSGDSETVTLSETGVRTGVFRGSIVTANNAATSSDGTLQATADKVVTVTYTDAQDARVQTDTVLLTAAGAAGSSNTGNSGGGSSRSRAATGGGGGGGGSPSVTPKPSKNVEKPVTRAPVKKVVAPKKKTVAERRAERIEKSKAAKAKAKARAADRRARK